MRKLIISILFAGVVLAGCEKETKDVSTVVTVTYPTINLIGPEFVHIPIGGSFTDQGATLIDDLTGAQSSISPSESDLDATTPGMYKVRYTAANANGFKTTATRVILVLDYTPPPGLDTTFDISGDWQRTNGIDCKVVRMAPGLYIIDNFAGSSLIYPAYLLTPDTTSVDIPAQISFDGFALDCNSETFDNTPPATMSWKVDAEGFGTATRTFIKQ